MPIERLSGGSSLINVLDRILDKGIVIDDWVRVSLVGIDLITVDARVVVASIETYLRYSDAVAVVAPVSRPMAMLTVSTSPDSDRRNDNDDDEGGTSGDPRIRPVSRAGDAVRAFDATTPASLPS